MTVKDQRGDAMKMTVDGYEVGSEVIKTVIDKLTEADGSPTNRIGYLVEAAALLAEAVAEEAQAEVES